MKDKNLKTQLKDTNKKEQIKNSQELNLHKDNF